MTALVASFGFVPMAIAHSAGAEAQRSLATVGDRGALFEFDILDIGVVAGFV
jgi:cobalt-zinc-cadmium resistance protein CzcA